MSTSGGSGHHRTFSTRPNSSQGRFAPQQQNYQSPTQQLQQQYLQHYSSLPTPTTTSPAGFPLPPFSRLQRHQSFIHHHQLLQGQGQGGSVDRGTASYSAAKEGIRTSNCIRYSEFGIRTVELCKDEENPSFGFNIKGGTDFGTPVHIWRVEDNSLADRKGLRRGQRILQANSVDFTRISHVNALKVLKGQHYLKLLLDTKMSGGGSSSNVNKSSASSSSMVVLDNTPTSSSIVGSSFHHSHHPHSSAIHNFRPSSASAVSASGGVGGISSSAMSASSTYTWIDGSGKIVPPPTPSTLSNNKRVINIDISPGQNLGLMIRGGYEYGLGIFVTGVDHGSVAQRAGLQRGDEILEVNGRNFSSITHDKAVQILKSCRKMTIIANYIGKIPADNQTSGGGGIMPIIDSENSELIDLGGSTGGKLLTTSMSESLHHHHNILMDSTNVTLFDDDDQDLIAEEEKLNDQNLELDYTGSDPNRLHQDLEKSTSIMGMIEEKARTVLTKSEHSRFTFYRLEYQQGFLPIQTFVRILLELLNTVEKYTLLTEVREIIRPIDMISFDELIYNKEASVGGGGTIIDRNKKQIQQQQLLHRSDFHPNDPSINSQMCPDPMLLPLVPVNQNPQVINGGGVGGVGVHGMRSSNTISSPMVGTTQYNMNAMYNETTFTTTSTPETNRQLLITHGDTQNVVAKLQQQKLTQGFGGIQQQQQQQNASPNNSCVRYKVRVQKTKPILGIAIEGGNNTPHRLPRIIDVNTEGSAYGSQLKPGQVLLTVDGKKLDGLSHEEIARCILDSYVSMSNPQIEFLVVEAKASFVQSQQQLLNAIPPPPGSNNLVAVAAPMGIIPIPPNPGG